MHLKYQITKDHLKQLASEYFYSHLWKFCIIFFIIAYYAAVTNINNSENWQKATILFLLLFSIPIAILFILFYTYVFLLIKLKSLFLGERIITFSELEITITKSNKTSYSWDKIKKIVTLKSYILIFFRNSHIGIISLNQLSKNEVENLYTMFNSRIKNGKVYCKKIPKKHSNKMYYLGFAGLLPFVGLVIGSFLIYLGYKEKKNYLKNLGVMDILFTPLFCFLVICFLNIKNTLKDSKKQLESYNFQEIVKDIEFYKITKGQYPDSLNELKEQNLFFNSSLASTLYYKKIDTSYIIKSYGEDKILNTEDDIIPNVKKGKNIP